MYRKRNKIWYFCPWQTCSAWAYSQKGTTNRSHIRDHVRRHLASNQPAAAYVRKKPRLHVDNELNDEGDELGEEGHYEEGQHGIGQEGGASRLHGVARCARHA